MFLSVNVNEIFFHDYDHVHESAETAKKNFPKETMSPDYNTDFQNLLRGRRFLSANPENLLCRNVIFKVQP